MEQVIKELTLLLIYLTSWQEEEFSIKIQRSWKGYHFLDTDFKQIFKVTGYKK